MGGAVDLAKKASGSVLGSRGTNLLFGKESGQKLPGQYQAQDVGKAAQGYLGGVLGATQGEQAGQDVMAKMQAGLGGYTGEQERAMFQREADQVRAQQALGGQQAAQQAQAGGLGGGFAAKMQERLAQGASAQQAGLGRDLSLQNIAEQQRRLQNLGQYAGGMAGVESARRGQAFGAAAQQANEQQNEYQSAFQRFQADPRKQSGGIFGGVAEKALPGLGGNIYSGLRFG
jgi:hypothetical protein